MNGFAALTQELRELQRICDFGLLLNIVREVKQLMQPGMDALSQLQVLMQVTAKYEY